MPAFAAAELDRFEPADADPSPLFAVLEDFIHWDEKYGITATAARNRPEKNNRLIICLASECFSSFSRT
jgi:hypothetical protein